MKPLTGGESRVIGALLSSHLISERARLHRAAVPRSSYHSARRRAYGEGWLRDRYIPNPVEYGLPFAGVTLARPFAERLTTYFQESIEDPGTVYVAGTAQLALTIGWYATEAQASSASRRAERGGFAAWSFPVVADLREPSVPVYFDFEGSFGHFALLSGLEGYPQGLAGSAAGPSGSDEFERRRRSWAAQELLHRPFQHGEKLREPHRVGPVGVPWGQQKLLNAGWIVHRVLLDPGRLPPYLGRSIRQQVFVVGNLRKGRRPEELFATLTRSCRVFPFLFVAAGGRILLGALGSDAGVEVGAGSLGERRSVLGAFRDAMEGIEILQESADQIQTCLDHRYDRLFDLPGRSS